MVWKAEEAGEDEDAEGANDEDGEFEGVEVAAARTDAGMDSNCCIALGSGLPPALPRASSPHVVGSTPSLDVMPKVGVFLKSSPAKSSTCMWQTPF